ncbi:MAG: hypothetical protein K2Q22_12915, partial [Cytophagales bacterium]|nr:hypothetical protein [Cytophagales bacterium]
MNIAGTAAIPNNGSGIQIFNNSTANFIGGLNSNERNVISGNVGHAIQISSGCNLTQIYGNYLGTDITGLNSISNGINGIDIFSSYNYIGNSITGSGNLISGNNGHGIYCNENSNYNTIKGNIIGLNKDGNGVIENKMNGISLAASSFNTVGGLSIQERNIVSGNGSARLNPGDPINQFSGISASTYNNSLPSIGNIIIGNYVGVGADGVSQFENKNHAVWITRASTNNLSFSLINNVLAINDGNSYPISGLQNRSVVYLEKSNLPSLIQGNTI